ncbi:hypothetical protein [Caballeronia telluris]|uniref:Uncharacterized protein n=1 Tax=Caballeronia telluris TaxID=326475 RepID=A0A158K9A1_9BURK|nr:hypothetical protein [Caballeronia telluris]SAL77021.1 hypothetical protein AWB66_05537 [Caballeronia telluris]
MELAQLSCKPGAFHLPAFAVRVSRCDLLRDLLIPVSDLVLSSAWRFSFTVTDVCR